MMKQAEANKKKRDNYGRYHFCFEAEADKKKKFKWLSLFLCSFCMKILQLISFSKKKKKKVFRDDDTYIEH